MCIFTGPVDTVTNTKIFATMLGGESAGTQFTCYNNVVELKNANPVAMVIGLPNPTGEPDKINMFDMSPYPEFFDKLQSLFHAPVVYRGMKGPGLSMKNSPPKVLPVLKCGPYSYSVAPTFADLKRIDWTRFEMSPDVEKLLESQYANNGFGFLVCLCSETGSYPTIGVTHPALANGELFLPTMHEHAGGADGSTVADWDHTIYAINSAQVISESALATTLGQDVFAAKKFPARDPSSVLDYARLPADFPKLLTEGNINFLVGFCIRGEYGNGDLTLIDSGRVVQTRLTGCSFKHTGDKRWIVQDSFSCETCYPNAKYGLGVCSYCAGEHTKQGHSVYQNDIDGGFYCDGPALEAERIAFDAKRIELERIAAEYQRLMSPQN